MCLRQVLYLSSSAPSVQALSSVVISATNLVLKVLFHGESAERGDHLCSVQYHRVTVELLASLDHPRCFPVTCTWQDFSAMLLSPSCLFERLCSGVDVKVVMQFPVLFWKSVMRKISYLMTFKYL
jgi:hypothetical protein